MKGNCSEDRFAVGFVQGASFESLTCSSMSKSIDCHGVVCISSRVCVQNCLVSSIEYAQGPKWMPATSQWTFNHTMYVTEGMHLELLKSLSTRSVMYHLALWVCRHRLARLFLRIDWLTGCGSQPIKVQTSDLHAFDRPGCNKTVWGCLAAQPALC